MTHASIKEKARAVMPYMIEARRALHAIPEIGFELPETRAYIAKSLTRAGIPFEEDKRGWITATIAGALPGPVVALRADMDALPIHEENDTSFTSTHPGQMHACGHDAHMACLLGAAEVLNGLRGTMSGVVRLFFQPAEESVGGARPMVEAGVMDAPKVDYVFGLHMEPGLPVGTVETRAGAIYAATDDLRVHVLGTAAHGAEPQKGADAIVCAAQVVTALQCVVSRAVAPETPCVVHIGSMHGGNAQNVVCDSVRLFGTVRNVDPETRERVRARIPEIVRGVCAAYGCDAEVEVRQNYPLLVNDPDATERVLDAARGLFGTARVMPTPIMCGEDFAFFAQRAPSAYFRVGSGLGAPLHNARFQIDEEALFVGCCMHLAVVDAYAHIR